MQLDDKQIQITQAVFSHFDEKGEWPLIGLFEVEFRHLGNIREIVKSTGNELIFMDDQNINGKQGRIKLRLEGLALCENANSLLTALTRVIKFFAETYIRNPLDAKVSTSDLSTEFKFSDLLLKKVSQLVYESTGLWMSASESDGSCTFEISPAVLQFENIQTFSDYLDIKKAETKNYNSSFTASKSTTYPSDALRRFQLDYPVSRKAAFVIMPFQNTGTHDKIYEVLKTTLKQQDIVALRADEKAYSDELWYNIETYMRGCEFGIAVLERLLQEDVNPNVSLEIGYMLALDKPVCLLKDQTIKKLQSDLIGKLYVNFDTQDPEGSIPLVLNKWLRDKGFIK